MRLEVRIPGGGFMWARGKGGSRWLTPLWDVPGRGLPRSRAYDPMREQPFLYDEFCRLQGDEDAFLTFANRWGALGIDEPATRTRKGGWEWGESFRAWSEQVRRMRNAVGVWNELRGDSDEALARRFRLIPRGVEDEVHWRAEDPDFDEPVIRLGSSSPLLIQRVPSANYREAGFAALLGLINAGIAGSTTAELEAAPGRVHLTYAPRTLLGALWLQLALVVAGNREPRTCEYCFGLFEIPTRRDPDHPAKRNGRSIGRRWCSDKCRYDAGNARSKERERQRRLLAVPKTPPAPGT